MSRWYRGAVVLIFGASLVAMGCAEEVTELGAKHDLRITSVPDSFTVDAKDLENVYDQIDTTWVITGPQAHINHRSFIPHGETELTIRDATGEVVYQRVLLFDIEAFTDSGVAGEWQVTIDLFGVTGRVGLTLTKAQ
ncbi:MAG TPA: hypothetical protein VFP10_14340 [Candidatus Eisenbacteria bacterium]|nr:hypothetical protein [Candidatus Eisenbacteria bacterium]